MDVAVVVRVASEEVGFGVEPEKGYIPRPFEQGHYRKEAY